MPEISNATPLIVVRELKRQTAVASSAIERWVVSPALAHWHVASSSSRLDSPPGSMCRESDHGIPHMGASAARPDAHRGRCVYHERAEAPPARGLFCRADVSADQEIEKLVDAEALCRMIPSAHLVNMAP